MSFHTSSGFFFFNTTVKIIYRRSESRIVDNFESGGGLSLRVLGVFGRVANDLGKEANERSGEVCANSHISAVVRGQYVERLMDRLVEGATPRLMMFATSHGQLMGTSSVGET